MHCSLAMCSKEDVSLSRDRRVTFLGVHVKLTEMTTNTPVQPEEEMVKAPFLLFGARGRPMQEGPLLVCRCHPKGVRLTAP